MKQDVQWQANVQLSPLFAFLLQKFARVTLVSSPLCVHGELGGGMFLKGANMLAKNVGSKSWLKMLVANDG